MTTPLNGLFSVMLKFPSLISKFYTIVNGERILLMKEYILSPFTMV